MLVRRDVLDRIVSGEIDLVFRRQRRPTVKSGGSLKTVVGVLDIVSVEPVALDRLSEEDARRAGYVDVEQLRADLTQKPVGEFYRVTVRFAGADPRIALREDVELTEHDVASIAAKLDRYDAGAHGPWTRQFLRMIEDQPNVRAPDLAASIGWETKPFKEHVRKLKTLGLTISHSPGYEVSPRGLAFLDRDPLGPV